MSLATIFAGYITQQTVKQKLARFFDRQVDQIGTTFHSNISTHVSVLNGLQGLWNTKSSLDHQSFLTYVNSLSPNTTYQSGISSLFYIMPVPNADRKTFENTIRTEKNITLVYQSFTIHPDSVAEILYPVVYVEPVKSRENTVGNDFSTFPERLKSVEYARDQGLLATTNLTTFVSTGKPGFLFFLPLYQPGLPTDSLEERQKAFRGLIGASYRADSAFGQIFGKTDTYPYQDFQIYQGEDTTPDRLLYDHDPSFTAQNPRFETTRVVRLQGQTWTIKAQSKPNFSLLDEETRLPALVFISGFLITTLLIVFSLSQYFKATK